MTWEDLADVTFTEKYFPEYGQFFLYPKFGDLVKTFEGETVKIKGYFLNISPQDKLFILSKSPWASCFFCGMAGPETAVELQFDDPPRFKTDDIVTITGKFVINPDDVMHFNYILVDCKAEKVVN